MGMFGNWGFRREHYCPKCFNNKGVFFGYDYICDTCKWKGEEMDLLTKQQVTIIKRKEIISKIKEKICIKPVIK